MHSYEEKTLCLISKTNTVFFQTPAAVAKLPSNFMSAKMPIPVEFVRLFLSTLHVLFVCLLFAVSQPGVTMSFFLTVWWQTLQFHDSPVSVADCCMLEITKN